MKRCCLTLLGLFLSVTMLFSQQQYKEAFRAAYEAFPQIPSGLLEAISYTNTHCHHLTDANYVSEDANAMPRAYGLMGLVENGKGYFRENLERMSQLSGYAMEEIKTDPVVNVMAYAKAFAVLSKEEKVKTFEDHLQVVEQLSELPMGSAKDRYPMQSMLYSVCSFLNDRSNAKAFGFEPYNLDMKALFGDDLQRLSAKTLLVASDADYPQAIWDPAPECNYGERTDPVSGVVIHYTEGSYAGCISWFKNCDAQVSAHYVIRSFDGQVTQMVREADKAWHARSANAYTIGIEHEAYGNVIDFFTEAMYRSSADLVRDICSRYETIDGHRTFYRDTLDNGICLNEGLHDLGGETACIKIRGHQHYPNQSHVDPGPYWDWNYYYKLINEGTPVTRLTGEEGDLDHRFYGDDERKIWVIESPEDTKITLDFSSFDLESDYDFLWIYDGDDVYAPKLGRWNTKSPGKVVSSGNVVCLEFRSDCATNDLGWRCHWKAEKPAPPEPPVEELPIGVYPNPASDEVYVNVGESVLAEVAIYDLLGNRVLPVVRFMGSTTVNVSGLPAGIYVIHYGQATVMESVTKLVIL